VPLELLVARRLKLILLDFLQHVGEFSTTNSTYPQRIQTDLPSELHSILEAVIDSMS